MWRLAEDAGLAVATARLVRPPISVEDGPIVVVELVGERANDAWLSAVDEAQATGLIPAGALLDVERLTVEEIAALQGAPSHVDLCNDDGSPSDDVSVLLVLPVASEEGESGSRSEILEAAFTALAALPPASTPLPEEPLELARMMGLCSKPAQWAPLLAVEPRGPLRLRVAALETVAFTKTQAEQ